MKHLIATLAASAAIATSAAAAELKIATVNMVDLVRLHPNHESNKTLVKTTDREYKEKLQKRQEELRQFSDDMKKVYDDLQNPMLSAAAKSDAQKKMEDLQKRGMQAQQQFRMEAQRFQSDLAELEGRLLKMETEEIRAKVEAFAKKNGYDVVADSTMLVFSNAKFDVTDEILKSMNVDPAKRKEKKASEGK